MRRSDQEGAEVTGVVGIGHADGGSRAKLAHERTQARHQADQIVRSKGQDGILDGVLPWLSENSQIIIYPRWQALAQAPRYRRARGYFSLAPG